MESSPNSPKRCPLVIRIAIGAALILSVLFWASIVTNFKISSVVTPASRQDIETYALIFGVLKAGLIFGPVLGIKAIMKSL